MFRGRLSDLLLNTLLVMNDHGRVGMLSGLLRTFSVRQLQAAGQIEVVATSATELDDAARRQVASTAAEVSGKQPIIDWIVDPSLIGGLVLQIGDWRYDNSVRRQLRAAQRKLLQRSERGLEVGLESL
jgi:F-type H+-transporting ATPase subunit delta